eukprot:jgi/Tetstr1/439177/TSEL_002997.t1
MSAQAALRALRPEMSAFGAEMWVGDAEMGHRHGKMWQGDFQQRHPKAPDGLTGRTPSDSIGPLLLLLLFLLLLLLFLSVLILMNRGQRFTLTGSRLFDIGMGELRSLRCAMARSSWPTGCDGDMASQCGGWACKNTNFRAAPNGCYYRCIIGERSGDREEGECIIRISSPPMRSMCMSYLSSPDCVGYLPLGLEACVRDGASVCEAALLLGGGSSAMGSPPFAPPTALATSSSCSAAPPLAERLQEASCEAHCPASLRARR